MRFIFTIPSVGCRLPSTVWRPRETARALCPPHELLSFEVLYECLHLHSLCACREAGICLHLGDMALVENILYGFDLELAFLFVVLVPELLSLVRKTLLCEIVQVSARVINKKAT